MRDDGITEAYWTTYLVPAIRRMRKNKCEICGANKYLDVHHEIKNRIININTLKLLCKSCHHLYHRHPSSSYKKILDFLNKNLNKKFTISEICKEVFRNKKSKKLIAPRLSDLKKEGLVINKNFEWYKTK